MVSITDTTDVVGSESPVCGEVRPLVGTSPGCGEATPLVGTSPAEAEADSTHASAIVARNRFIVLFAPLT
jgi:hypothetical protein